MFRGLEISQVRLILALIGVFFAGIMVERTRLAASAPMGASAPALQGNVVRHARGELVDSAQQLPAPAPIIADSPTAEAATAIAVPAGAVDVAPMTVTPTEAAERPASIPKVAPTHPVNVNRASHEELETLSLVGEKLALRILNERSARGPFRSAEDLSNRVKGIGPKIIEQNRTRLRFE
ncbi:DUF655 domain-containing protein [Candidatus Sumerlaeota bacterium]|nr:DUF655 domain-containing protein [Candidatus Sumerlaeota bacterium]